MALANFEVFCPKIFFTLGKKKSLVQKHLNKQFLVKNHTI